MLFLKINLIIRYEAGDHIAVYASNNPVDVDKLCRLLGVDGEETFSLENVDGNISNKFLQNNSLINFRGQLKEIPLSLPYYVQNRYLDLDFLKVALI